VKRSFTRRSVGRKSFRIVGPAQLLVEAENVDAACDLAVGVPAELARVLATVLTDGDLASASPRAVWNLLWLAGELSTMVDVFRATALLTAVERVFIRHFALVLHQRDELTDAAEMAFDFFFNRADQPLASLHVPTTIASLATILLLDNRFCRRAALHGLGHLRQHTPVPHHPAIDALLTSVTDPTLTPYASQALSGTLL